MMRDDGWFQLFQTVGTSISMNSFIDMISMTVGVTKQEKQEEKSNLFRQQGDACTKLVIGVEKFSQQKNTFLAMIY